MTSQAAAASLLDTPKIADTPEMPRTIEATGIAVDQIEQLLIKTLYQGEAIGTAVADRMRLTFGILEPLIERARAERLMEVRGATGSGSASYRYALTDLGRDRTRQYLEINSYIGPTPVPLAAYVAEVRALATKRGYIDRERLRQAFSHLIVGDHSPQRREHLFRFRIG